MQFKRNSAENVAIDIKDIPLKRVGTNEGLERVSLARLMLIVRQSISPVIVLHHASMLKNGS